MADVALAFVITALVILGIYFLDRFIAGEGTRR